MKLFKRTGSSGSGGGGENQLRLSSDVAFPGIRTTEVPSDDQIVLKRGMLQKRGDKVKNWTSRMFELRAESLKYYQVSSTSSVLKGEIGLPGNMVRPCQSKTSKQHTFEIVCPKRIYLISAASR